ncbi:hypothetical protein [Roseibium sp.]|uniref:hypothetical protein n=1 Tax=Roseibium sp. TaxID=1936156 RepID=UPI0039EEADE9
MKDSELLWHIAEDRDWLSFAKSLSAAMSEPDKHGFTDGERLLGHVAHLRGSDPSSLRNPLAAYSWLEQYAPEALKLDGQKFPMTGVITLSQISKLSEKTGSDAAPKFFRGDLTRKDLKTILKDLQQQKGGQGVRGHERYKNSVAFEEMAREFLIENQNLLGLGPRAEIVSTRKDALLPSDLTILFKGEPVGAIEIKSHRHKRHRRYLVETIAMGALLANEYGLSIMVVPSSWDTSIAEIKGIIRKLRLDRLKLFVFHEAPDLDPQKRLRFATERDELLFLVPESWS